MTFYSFIKRDCIEWMEQQVPESIDIIITSPPYNLNIKYGKYDDNLKYEKYLEWIEKFSIVSKKILKDNGSLFINVGYSNINPWISIDVANIIRKNLILQNRINWIKSISIDDKSFGHFKPINSERYLNVLNEDIFHFTKKGNVKLDRLSIGVPYSCKSNISRWNKKSDTRCLGNSWFIPYKTIKNKNCKGNHPAIFPEKLVENCIKLHGIKNNMVVLDPFMGSGTTGLVCKSMNISFIGCEIDDDYMKYSIERIFSCNK